MKISITERIEWNGKVIERTVSIEPTEAEAGDDLKALARRLHEEIDAVAYQEPEPAHAVA